MLAGVVLHAPDQAWVADLTYIRLRSAFVYLACILDAFSRRCVGWHLSREMTTQLTLTALQQAIAERRPQPGLIHHSDRGVKSCKLRVCGAITADRCTDQHVIREQSV